MGTFNFEYLGIELPLRAGEQIKYKSLSRSAEFIKYTLAKFPLYSTEMMTSGKKRNVKINMPSPWMLEKSTGYKGKELEIFYTSYMGSAEALAMIYTGHTLELYEEANRISGNRLNSFIGVAHSADEIFQRAFENNKGLDSQIREMIEQDAKVGSLVALKKRNYNMGQILGFLSSEAKQGRIYPEHAYKML